MDGARADDVSGLPPALSLVLLGVDLGAPLVPDPVAAAPPPDAQPDAGACRHVQGLPEREVEREPAEHAHAEGRGRDADDGFFPPVRALVQRRVEGAQKAVNGRASGRGGLPGRLGIVRQVSGASTAPVGLIRRERELRRPDVGRLREGSRERVDKVPAGLLGVGL